MHNLAVLDAQDGGAGKPDYAEAATWFRRAAELGIRDSQFNLGVLAGRGLGIPQDLGNSWLWFSLASRQGDADAAKKRDEVAAKFGPHHSRRRAESARRIQAAGARSESQRRARPRGRWDAKSPQATRTIAPARRSCRRSRRAYSGSPGACWFPVLRLGHRTVWSSS